MSMSAGGNTTCGDSASGDSGEGDVDKWRGIKIGDELLESEGTGEEQRWGIGDIRDGGIILGGGSVIIMGGECGLLSCSSSACASLSYRRAMMRCSVLSHAESQKMAGNEVFRPVRDLSQHGWIIDGRCNE